MIVFFQILWKVCQTHHLGTYNMLYAAAWYSRQHYYCLGYLVYSKKKGRNCLMLVEFPVPNL